MNEYKHYVFRYHGDKQKNSLIIYIWFKMNGLFNHWINVELWIQSCVDTDKKESWTNKFVVENEQQKKGWNIVMRTC